MSHTNSRALVVNRKDVESCASLALEDDETGISTDAADLFDELSDLLLYQRAADELVET